MPPYRVHPKLAFLLGALLGIPGVLIVAVLCPAPRHVTIRHALAGFILSSVIIAASYTLYHTR